jgi:serine/threonine protein kinase
MSPEQIRGMPLDARTDVFSAGIILHEMLTTEKLFRGDTEFALMEKVRKAEVPPPSNFNRRVTPELDAISLKALARDVADRYQSAAQLAADLDALIEGYRFDPKELRQFMRQLFRKEYAKEQEDTQMSLDIEPGGLSMSMTTGGGRLTTQPGVGTPTETVPRNTVQGSGPQPPPPEITTEPAGPVDEDKPKGFWGSLFKKRK